jgi:penicillin G amidase
MTVKVPISPVDPPINFNVLTALLTEERQRAFASFSPEERHLFYGRLIESIIANPDYRRIVFDTAAMEFDKLFREQDRKDLELQALVEQIVLIVLAVIERLRSEKPDEYSERIVCEPLRDRVDVRKDSRGISYIKAREEWDLFCAQGYVTASDRLWQMDMLRRVSRGELSEILGGAFLEQDKHFRAYGFGAIAERVMANAPADFYRIYEAYAAGVNEFIAHCKQTAFPLEFQLLQYEPKPWSPVDSILVGKIYAESLSTNWPNDLMRASFGNIDAKSLRDLFRETSPLDTVLVGNDEVEKPAKAQLLKVRETKAKVVDLSVLPDVVARKRIRADGLRLVGLYAKGRSASNNWVVSGAHTASGKPMLANDPHLSPSAPSLWYLTHLRTDDFAVAGVTTPGIPGIVVGHNERIAWGVTNLGADTQEVYQEQFDPDSPNQYRTPDGWQTAEIRREEIKVRQALDNPNVDSVFMDVRVTRHGPIVFGQGTTLYSLHWTALDDRVNELIGFHSINRAKNWDEFQQALSIYAGPPQNFIYADVDGNTGYSVAGRIPRTNSLGLPRDGAADPGGAEEFLGFDEMPRLYNPPSGWIATANNRVVGLTFPYRLTHDWTAPYRSRRINDLLEQANEFTLNDFLQIQGDTYSYADVIFTNVVVNMAAPLAQESPEWQEILNKFEYWNGLSSSGSREVTLAALMRNAFARRVLVGKLQGDLAESYSRWPTSPIFIDFLIQTQPPEWLPGEFGSYEELILQTYRDARTQLTNLLGPDESNWTWGRVDNPVIFVHPLSVLSTAFRQFAIAPLPSNSGGGGATVNAGAFVSMRFVTDLSDWDTTRLGIPLGQSGDPRSTNWNDQLSDWRNTIPQPFHFSEAKINEAAQYVIKLTSSARSSEN